MDYSIEITNYKLTMAVSESEQTIYSIEMLDSSNQVSIVSILDTSNFLTLYNFRQQHRIFTG